MVPITVVTGFLGAGKTTLLSHVLRDPQGLKLAVLVNDFGAVNIDAELLRDTGEEIISLENGCICCSLSQGLLSTVSRVLRRPDPPDRILIEASGVSDPFEIVETLSDPELREYAPLDGVVAVVDAEAMADPAPAVVSLARRQVACAGLVLLNKMDLAEAGGSARTWVRSISAHVPIVETRRAAVPLPTLLGIGASGDPQADSGEAPSFESTVFTSTSPLSLQRLHDLLGTLPRGIVRVKGTVSLVEKPDHRCLVQVSGRRATLTVGQPWDDEIARTRIVFIGMKGSVDAAKFRSNQIARGPHSIVGGAGVSGKSWENAGDTLVVMRIDCLALSLSHLLEVIGHRGAKGAFFRSLQDPIDTDSPQGKFTRKPSAPRPSSNAR